MKEAIFAFLIALVMGAGINGLLGAGMLANPSPMEKSADPAQSSVGASQDPTLIADTSDNKWASDVTQSNTPVFVDFYEDGCQPCKEMEPVISKLASEYKGKVKFLKVNALQPDTQAIVKEYNIQGLPSYFIIKSGKTVESYSGLVPYNVLNTVMSKVSA